MSTIVDVALKAKVSIATVSRVTNSSPHKVNPTTRAKVIKAIRELDYRPNALAKGLLMKRTMTVGIIIPDISNPYYAEIVRGIQDKADDHGYAVILLNTERNQDRILKHIYFLREKAADGIIFSGGVIHEGIIISSLKELRDRVIVIGQHRVDFPSVVVDNAGGATEAVRYLIELGSSADRIYRRPGRVPLDKGTAFRIPECVDPAGLFLRQEPVPKRRPYSDERVSIG